MVNVSFDQIAVSNLVSRIESSNNRVSFPFKQNTGSAVSDNVVDNDGLVGIDSALAVTLGTNDAWYFDHSRQWNIGGQSMRGSWYRVKRGAWEYENHDSIKFNPTLGKYLHRLIGNSRNRGAGPIPGTADVSIWPRQSSTFQPDTPKVLVFIHGKTQKPVTANQTGTSPGLISSINPSGDAKNGDYNHFFGYWGFEQTVQILGARRTLRTLSNRVINQENWNTNFLNGQPNVADHFFVADNERFRPGQAPGLSAMITYRDGSRSLLDQATDVINQITKLYDAQFGRLATKPHIVLVAHSMGGLVARRLLTVGDLPDSVRKKAQAITDNTLYLITLATPHEGTRIADKAMNLGDLAQWADQVPDDFINLAIGQMQNLPSDRIQELAGDIGEIKLINWSQYFHEELDYNDPATHDLQTSVWQDLNRNQLAPHLAARNDGSLVPVYCFGGRSPGGEYFANPNTLLGGIEPWEVLRDRDKFNATGLVFHDLIMQLPRVEPFDWGVPHADADQDLDTVQRTTQKELAEPERAIVRAGFKLLGKLLSLGSSGAAAGGLVGLAATAKIASIAIGAGTAVGSILVELMGSVPYYLRHEWDVLGPVDAIAALKQLGLSAGEIFDYLLDSYTDSFAEASVWMVDAGMDFVDTIKTLVAKRIDLDDIAIMIRDRMNRVWEEIAEAFKAARVSSYNVTRLLAQVFRAGVEDVVEILHKLWRQSVTSAFRRIKAYFSPEEIIRAFRSVYQISVESAANFLKQLGRLGLDAANILLRVGYALEETATTMFNILNSSIDDIADFLRARMGNVIDVARMLRDITDNPEAVVKILKNKFRQSITTVAQFLKEDWQYSAKSAGALMLDVGYRLKDIIEVFYSVFKVSVVDVLSFIKEQHLSESWIDVAEYLYKAGYSYTEIAKRVRTHYSLSVVTVVREMNRFLVLSFSNLKSLLMSLGLNGFALTQALASLA